jgi:hypothetical protein
MAILKTLKGNRVGSTYGGYWFGANTTSGTSHTNHNYYDHFKGNNYALIEDPLDNTLYFADSSNDSVNMNPNFSKSIPFAHLFSKNISHAFAAKNLYAANSPRLIASYNDTSPDVDEEIHSTQYMNYSFKYNLDLQEAYQSGNYRQFQINNDNFYLFIIPNRDGVAGADQSTLNNTAPTSMLILAQGNTLQTSTYITRSFNSSPIPSSLDIVSVNKDEQIIYLSGLIDTYRNATDGEYTSSNYSGQIMIAIPFNIVSLNNEFSFGEAKIIVREKNDYANYTGFGYGHHYNIHYIGRDNSDKDCFLVVGNQKKWPTQPTQRSFLFLKIDYTQFQSTTAFITNDFAEASYLDCFEVKEIILDADPANANHYANQFNSGISKFYNFDPTTPNSLWAYLPLFKNNGDLTIAAINWDKSQPLWSDNFTLHQDILSGQTFTQVVNPYTITPTLSRAYGAGKESGYKFFLSEGNKLNLIFNYVSKPFYDDVTTNQTLLFNNCLTFDVDITSPTTLAYENTSQIPALASMILRDPNNNNYYELFVIEPLSYSSYSYTAQSGWTSNVSQNIQLTEVVFDSYSRRWAIEHSPLTQYTALVTHNSMYLHEYDVRLHLLSQVLPYTTSVAFQNTNITYTNVNINNNLLINAYDEQGNRIETSVLITMEGSNIEFDTSIGGGTTTIVTTSANTDTVVPVVITGPGYANVSVSFDV